MILPRVFIDLFLYEVVFTCHKCEREENRVRIFKLIHSLEIVKTGIVFKLFLNTNYKFISGVLQTK
jgi:hypothetical protein